MVQHPGTTTRFVLQGHRVVQRDLLAHDGKLSVLESVPVASDLFKPRRLTITRVHQIAPLVKDATDVMGPYCYKHFPGPKTRVHPTPAPKGKSLNSKNRKFLLWQQQQLQREHEQQNVTAGKESHPEGQTEPDPEAELGAGAGSEAD